LGVRFINSGTREARWGLVSRVPKHPDDGAVGMSAPKATTPRTLRDTLNAARALALDTAGTAYGRVVARLPISVLRRLERLGCPCAGWALFALELRVWHRDGGRS
jgi:hypothetical protein